MQDGCGSFSDASLAYQAVQLRAWRFGRGVSSFGFRAPGSGFRPEAEKKVPGGHSGLSNTRRDVCGAWRGGRITDKATEALARQLGATAKHGRVLCRGGSRLAKPELSDDL